MKKTTFDESSKTTKNLDLNLLTTFEAVLTHQSGSKAADAMGVTPSAVSQALGRLRVYYNDPLFIRHGKKLTPTSVAIGIHEGIAEAYENLMAKLQIVSFSSVPTRLVVNTSPFISVLALGIMRNILDEFAPECELVHTINKNSMSEVEDTLLFREADIVIDTSPHFSLSRVSQRIFTDTLVVICRKNHPRLVDGFLSSEQSAQEKHISIDVENASILAEKFNVDAYLKREKKFIFSSPSLLSIISMVEATDLLAIVPQRFYDKFKDSFNVKPLSIDFTITPISFYIVFNKSSLNNAFFYALIEKLTSHFQKNF